MLDYQKKLLAVVLALMCITLLGMATVFYQLIYDTSPELPALARGLPADPQEASAEFSQRVQEAFPKGTPEKSMVTELKNQGFAVEETSASLTGRKYSCLEQWAIDWKNAKGTVRDLFARYGTTCH